MGSALNLFPKVQILLRVHFILERAVLMDANRKLQILFYFTKMAEKHGVYLYILIFHLAQ